MAMTKQRIMALKIHLSELSYLSMLLFGDISRSLRKVVSTDNRHQNITIPTVGTHVNITGSYVLDREHNSWSELHPVTSITVLK
jgi:hypothetical protein